jgi:hypothetical protein
MVNTLIAGKENKTIITGKDNKITGIMDNDLANAFQQLSTKNEMAEVLKELFDEKKLYMIGDLSKDEIKLATRIYVIADMKKIEIWKQGLAFYIRLLISKDRKSRKEILEAIKGYQQQQGFLSKMNPFNRGM